MTLEYYNHNAIQFDERTRGCNLAEHYDAFLGRMPRGGHILDAGCGPGRDSKAFLDRGYRVTSIDASSAMVALATQITGQPARLMAFREISLEDEFDGIWANASLLHVPRSEIDDVINRLTRSLKPRGVWSMSFKLGEGERIDKYGRMFNDYSEASLRDLISRNDRLELIEILQRRSESSAGELVDWIHARVTKR